MLTIHKQWKTLAYIPVTLGALAFAAFGISSIIQAQQGSASDQAASGDGSLAPTGQTQTLQANGGSCGPENCAACGYCAGSRITQTVETQPAALSDNGVVN